MHDRRIDGKIHLFGNAGGLFMNAMTWWDHETESIWSQPWGRAIAGELSGVELFVLPSQVVSWKSWRTEHPDTLVMINDVSRLGRRRQGFSPDFVIGILLAENAKAYYYKDVAAARVVNDMLGDVPVLIWAADNNFHTYVRQVNEQVLTFTDVDGQLVDEETGSTWNIANGLAIDGPLKGQALQSLPGTTAYDWAWLDFYPTSEIYRP